MNISEPFVRRPVGTSLLAAGVLLFGAVAYYFLPVAPLPKVDFPTISVNAQEPGVDPGTAASSLAAPLERRLAQIAGVSEITSVSSDVMNDRTTTIRSSVRDVQLTLLITMALVVMVMFLFLRRFWPTFIAGITMPLASAGTFGVMWLCGYSLDNLSLMALTVSTGFVVDDAIVVIENIVRFLEQGESPFNAAPKGARQIGFTVISISLSLVAVFIPLLFMSGLIGRLFHEFAVTLSTARSASARSRSSIRNKTSITSCSKWTPVPARSEFAQECLYQVDLRQSGAAEHYRPFREREHAALRQPSGPVSVRDHLL